ncbi:MAG: glycosyltransferase [Salibacteraceae bacterium]
MKIMVVLSRVPWPLEKGDKLRAYHLIREWSKNHEVVLFCLTDQPIDPLAEKKLNEICKQVLIHRLSKWGIYGRLLQNIFGSLPFQVAYFNSNKARNKFDRFLEENIPDHIFCQLTRTVEFVRKYSVLHKSIDYMDAFSVGMARMAVKAPWPKSMLMKLEHRRLHNYEALVQDDFNQRFIISDQDKEQMSHVRDMVVVPNGIDPVFLEEKNQNTRPSIDILFTGNMAYRPNIESAKLLVREVMPLVWKSLPNTKVCLAGATPTQEVKELSGTNVEITGWVADIASIYRDTKVFVAPMIVNTGLQNKLLEAMACRVPCITTSMANNALGAKPDEEVLIAEEPKDIAQHIITLLNNPTNALSIGKAGEFFVKNNFDWKASADAFSSKF